MIERLIYVHTAAIPSRAANVVQVLKTCAAFQEAGLSTRLFTPANGQRCSSEELREAYGLGQTIALRTMPAPRIPGRDLLYGLFCGLPSRMRFEREEFYTRSISVAQGVHALGHAVTVEMHAPLDSFRLRLQARFISLSRSNRFRVVVISDALRVDYERRVPPLQGRICVAHDAADALFSSLPPVSLSGDFKIGYVGHLYPGKGMEIIAALAPLCADMTFHIVGGTDADIEHWRVETRRYDNIVFHGYVPHAKAPAYVAAMDVVLAPYLRTVRGSGLGSTNLAQWMSPLKLFEYMAAAKPILVSDLPVIREVISHLENGLLCNPDRPEEWAAALSDLRGNTELRNALSMRAQQKFLDQYTWQKRAHRILRHIGHVPRDV